MNQGRNTGDISIPNLSLPDILRATVVEFGQQTAVSMYGKKMTYDELLHSVHVFASALVNSGVQKGDCVGVMLPNCPQYVIAYYGILTAGGVVTQINPMLVERELEHILTDSECKKIVVLDGLYERVASVKEMTNIEQIITVSFGDIVTPQLPDCSLQAFMGLATLPFTPPMIQPEKDIAVLQYTGGTTGRSKGAMLTHRNLVTNLYQIATFFGDNIYRGGEKMLTVTPLFHVTGMTICMNWSVFEGQEMIMLPRFQLEEVLQTIKSEKPTLFTGVPTMYVALTNHPHAEQYGIDSIRFCFCGSSPLPVELKAEFERKTGSVIYEGYGLSETSPLTHCNPPFANKKIGSVGVVIGLTECKVVDLGTGEEECPVGELGEIIIKGPQVMPGYWKNPEETAHAIRQEWFYTGDIGRVDEEGYLYVVDRKKDMIIASGYNIYPRDIEEVLYEHPAIQECVVVGVPDEYRGETVKAVLVVKQGMAVTEEEVITYCREQLSAYKVPRIIEFRDDLPKTNVGKILRRAFREEAKTKK